jgi:hypothetical protein
MPDELLFHVSGSTATAGERISLADAGLKEREHVQEWVLANSQILGDDVMIVTFEFDRWLSGAKSQAKVRDRLDILGIDTAGTIVVAELKRDVAPDTVEMQAIKYASMAAQFTPATLTQAFQRHLAQAGKTVSTDEAAARLAEHAEGALDLKILRRPRIVLIAGDYPDTTMTSAIWLPQMGVHFTLVRYQAYRTPAGVHVTTSRLWPLDQAEDLVVHPEEREEVEAAQEQRRRSRSVVSRIIDAGLLEDGQLLAVAPDTQVTAEVRDQVAEWVAAEPTRARRVGCTPIPGACDGSRMAACGRRPDSPNTSSARLRVTRHRSPGQRGGPTRTDFVSTNPRGAPRRARLLGLRHRARLVGPPQAPARGARRPVDHLQGPRGRDRQRSRSASTSPSAASAQTPTGSSRRVAPSPRGSGGLTRTGTMTPRSS